MEALKPCPFCGGKGYVWSGVGDHYYRVCCINGCIRMPGCINEYFSTREKAIKTWNTRKGDAP